MTALLSLSDPGSEVQLTRLTYTTEKRNKMVEMIYMMVGECDQERGTIEIPVGKLEYKRKVFWVSSLF